MNALSSQAEKQLAEFATVFANTSSEWMTRLGAEQQQLIHTTSAKLDEMTTALASLGEQLEQPMVRLIETASETPKAAAEVMSLVQSSTSALANVESQIAERVDTHLEKITSATDNFAGSAVEMATLGDSFSNAVQLYNESNTELVQQLTRMEQAMAASTNRSDEQMAYYVAQAREIIDQSLLTQKDLFDELRAIKADENGGNEPGEELHAMEAS